MVREFLWYFLPFKVSPLNTLIFFLLVLMMAPLRSALQRERGGEALFLLLYSFYLFVPSTFLFPAKTRLIEELIAAPLGHVA